MALSTPLARARALALATPLLLLGGAYVSQYGFGLHPCEMCWWQRYPHFAALALAASGLIGAFHAGVEYGWWEGLTACSTSLAGDDPMKAIWAAPLVRCDVAPWSLFGISLAGWNFLFSCGAAALILALLLSDRKDRR